MINFLKSAAKNAVKGYKTTILGCVLFVAAILSVFYDKADWSEATVIVILGLTLIISPDSFKKKIENENCKHE